MAAASQTLGISKCIEVKQRLPRGRGGEHVADAFRDAAGAAVAIDKDNGDLGIDQGLVIAPDRLTQDDARPGEIENAGLDLEEIVDPRRLEEVGVDSADCKGERLTVVTLVQFGMADADQPDEVGAAALHEADIAAVIDDAGEVGVLEI